MAKQLLKDGYRVYAGARRLDQMADLAAAGARLVRIDVTDEASCVAAISTIRSETRRLDVLVNHAAFFAKGKFAEESLENVRLQFETNMIGTARVIRLALPMMKDQNAGLIFNRANVVYERPGAAQCWYHSHNQAMNGFSESLRLELKSFGINVLVLQPGMISGEWREAV
jgi:NAD(P)-dependent dehydrogenase (short-subunit alcohol dehydrogenase family)